jgi:hypothetical protein
MGCSERPLARIVINALIAAHTCSPHGPSPGPVLAEFASGWTTAACGACFKADFCGWEMDDLAEKRARIRQQGQEYGVYLVEATLAAMPDTKTTTEADAIPFAKAMAVNLRRMSLEMVGNGIPNELLEEWFDAAVEAVYQGLDERLALYAPARTGRVH